MVDYKDKFEYLEHTADIYVRAYGKNMKEAYENAALALFETMTDTQKITQTTEETIDVWAEDQYALLYSWLETLLVNFETKGMLYSKFKITIMDENDTGFKLKATVWGEPFDAKKHPQKVAVKAATYHLMMVIRETERVVLEFILDI